MKTIAALVFGLAFGASSAHAIQTCSGVANGSTVLSQISYEGHSVSAVLDCYDGSGTLELQVDNTGYFATDVGQGLDFATFGSSALFFGYFIQSKEYQSNFNYSQTVLCLNQPQDPSCTYQPGGG